jgi:hypothetical protein
MVEHTARAFHSDLQELARKILYMGRSDDEHIANAIEALLKRDAALARSVWLEPPTSCSTVRRFTQIGSDERFRA